MNIRSQMSSIMDVIRLELSKLSVLELEKIAIFDFVYTLASLNTDLSAPNLLTIQLYDQQTSDEFNYGYNRIRTFRVIHP